jgi:hypothetical protein
MGMKHFVEDIETNDYHILTQTAVVEEELFLSWWQKKTKTELKCNYIYFLSYQIYLSRYAL